MNPQATILSAAPGVYTDFRPALVLGSGLPTEIDGQPVKYAWKESLLLGKYRDARGKPFEVTPERIDTILGDFGRAKQKGYRPYITPSHNRTAHDSFGFIIDARKNDRGGLDLLHQLIGSDAHLAAARNGTSICTLRDVTDEHGETYRELIDHQAIVPDPQLRGLGPFEFQPAIAASRGGPALSAEVFTLAAEEPVMDIKAICNALGGFSPTRAELPSEAEIMERAKQLGALADANNTLKLELSRMTAERDAKGLELSRRPEPPKPLDPEVLTERRLRLNERADRLGDAGYLPADVAKLKTLLLGTDAAPNGLMLSRSDGASDCRAAEILDVLAQCRPAPKTGVQGIVASRQPTPGEDQYDAAAQAEDDKYVKDWQEDRRRARGLAPA